eukprot:jgi/Tetstr1/454180/TSEL_041099.t1
MSLTFTGNVAKFSSSAVTEVEWLDLVSQNSVVGGYQSGRYNTTGQFNLWFGHAVASDPLAVSGSENVGLGAYAASKNQGDFNTWVGSRAGLENVAGSENVGVGWSAGAQQASAHGNTALGFQGGYNALGDGNVSIGHNANSGGSSFLTHCNIAVGPQAHATGGDSLAVGADASVSGQGSTGIGAGTTVTGENAVVVGPYVASSGANSLLLMPRPDGTVSTHTEDEELNVYGVLKGRREGPGSYAVSLASDKVLLDSRTSRVSLNAAGIELASDKNITLLAPTTFSAPVTVSDTAVFSAPVVMSDGIRVAVGTSVFDGPAVFNGGVTFAASRLVYDTATAVNTVTRNLVVENAAAFSNGATFSNGARFLGTTVMDGTLVLNDAFEVLGGIDVGGDLAVTGNTVGTTIDMDAGRFGTLRVTDLDITGSIKLPAGMTLGGGGGGSSSNASAAQYDDLRASVVRVDSSLLVRGVATYEQDLHVAEAVHARTAMIEDVHSHKVVACQVTATNGTYSNIDAVRFHCRRADIDELTVVKYTAALSNDAILTANLVAASASVSNLLSATISASNLSSLIADIQTLSVSNVSVSHAITAGSAAFSNLRVDGLADMESARIRSLDAPSVTACNLAVSDSVTWINRKDPLGQHRWTAALAYNHAPSNQYADLVFTSTHGTVFTLTDDFEAGVLNFTGKHRCSWAGDEGRARPEPGLIVTTTGRFDNLNGDRAPTMDEALPVVKLSCSENDPRAFGVVAGHETPGQRVFRLANMVFSHGYDGDPKVILNSVGEGGMWVCNANGPVKNGDLLTTSAIAGHAQRQGDDIVRSCTVAKVTGDPAPWESFRDGISGRECVRAFVGVVYKF